MTYAAYPGLASPSLTRFVGPFIDLRFQDGPIREHGLNGTTNEEVIQLLIERITSLNDMEGGRFACPENDIAIDHLYAASRVLHERTAKRVERGVEGTNTP